MLTTNDFVFFVCNNGDIALIAREHFYNSGIFFVVEIAENVWQKNRAMQWVYSDRIVITPISNLKPTINDADGIVFIQYQDLLRISYGIQQSILRRLREYSKKWLNV